MFVCYSASEDTDDDDIEICDVIRRAPQDGRRVHVRTVDVEDQVLVELADGSWTTGRFLGNVIDGDKEVTKKFRS